jgi:hypothetical protein
MHWSGVAMRELLDLGQTHGLSAGQLDTVSRQAERNALIERSREGVQPKHVRLAFTSWHTSDILTRLTTQIATRATAMSAGRSS